MARSGEGNPSARIMIVGECYGEHDARALSPFQGTGGQELNRMLHEVGIQRSECYLTNVINERPPFGDIDKWCVHKSKRKDIRSSMKPLRDFYVEPIVLEGFHQLLREIHLVQPNIIVALGSTPLWVLTGALGITKWRGSQLRVTVDRSLYPAGLLGLADRAWAGKLIPTLHPSWVVRDYGQRPLVINDLKRVLKERDSADYAPQPERRFIVRPSFAVASTVLNELLAGLDNGSKDWIDFDLETRAGHIACAGLSWSKFEAISIPFMSRGDNNGYWMLEMEAELVWLLYRVLTHPKAKIRGQNLLYDAQYTYRHWHFVPRVAQDTMIAHHSMFCGLPKSLDFLASLYCENYVQWKPSKSVWKVGG